MGMRPLVTVGIPTYQRPDGLRRTLGCIVDQTYDHLEIVVSDNCSADDATGSVAREFAGRDSRVRYVRQPFNTGSVENCQFLLRGARGDYFMWAADDDWWSLTFIERCVSELISLGRRFVAVGMEAQYFVGDEELEFFPEGRAFYSGAIGDPSGRVDHMLRNGYGNLFYSLFRREGLIDGDRTALDFMEPHGNELPMFVEVAARGNWRILPSVGLHKQTNARTYLQARWEIRGGWLKPWRPSRIARLRHLAKYHRTVGRDIEKSLHRIGFDQPEEQRLRGLTRRTLGRHLVALMLGYKRRASRVRPRRASNE
jgi:glycosyltransferase involved in cell wall biosynthesis